MQFFNMAGFFFAAIIPLIIILYLLKRRYQEMMVSSNYLWEQVINDMEASMPWQRLKKNLLLFLQLLVAALLVLALSRPYLPIAGNVDRHIIAVLDCSASMTATDVFPSRFDEARKQLEKLIDGLGRNDKMTLIAMGEQSSVLASASGDKVQLRNALQDIRATTASADLEPALSIIASLSEDADNVSVIVFSDGKTRPLKSEVSLNCPVEFRQVGRDSNNAAISTLATRREAGQTVTLARIHNFGDEKIESELELLAGDKLLDVREISLEAGESREVIWEDLPLDIPVIKANLSRPDDLIADNQAYALVDNIDNYRALLVSQGNIFLEKSLLLLPGLDLFKTSIEDYGQGMEEYQLYIFDGCLPPHMPEGNIMLLNPPEGNSLFPVGEEIHGIDHIDAVPKEPLLKYVDVNDWQIALSKNLECPLWCRPLLKYQETPLLLAGERDNRKMIIFAFDLHNSNIPLQTGFPILINKLGSWMLPRAAEQIVLDSSRDVFSLEPVADCESIYIKRDGAEEAEFLPPFPQSFSAEESGLYQVTQLAGDKRMVSYLVKNQGDLLESNIRPGDLPWKQAARQEEAGKNRLNKQEIWIYLAWAAMLLLLLEWEVYRRGY